MTGNTEIDKQRMYVLKLLFEKDFKYSELYEKYQKQLGVTPDSTFSDRIKYLEANHFIRRSEHNGRVYLNYPGVYSYILDNKLNDYYFMYKFVFSKIPNVANIEIDVKDKRLHRAFRGFFRKQIIQLNRDITISELIEEFISFMGSKDYGFISYQLETLFKPFFSQANKIKTSKDVTQLQSKYEPIRNDLKKIVNEKITSYYYFGSLCYMYIYLKPYITLPITKELAITFLQNSSFFQDSDK